MKPRDFLSFFKTKSGRLITFAVLFIAGLVVYGVMRSRHASADDSIVVAPVGTNAVSKPQIVETVQRSFDLFRPPPPKASPPSVANQFNPNLSPQPLPNVPPHQSELLTPISLFADRTAGVGPAKKLSAVFAPFGRLIPCETVITVDSASIQTPIIGLVTDNIYYGGKLIVPAGTEVHGMAQTDRQRERIAGNTGWTFVWQNGQEMRIKAIALDREFDNETNQAGWAITDGSAGLRGEIIKSDNLADIKLFAATFLSGAANALTEKQQTVFGSVNAPSLNNAPFQGAQAVLQTYSQQIYDSIQKNGFYVRVPSGKQFYLYVLQTLDRADATLGGTGLVEENDEPTTTPAKP